jgi:hypothetical protein
MFNYNQTIYLYNWLIREKLATFCVILQRYQVVLIGTTRQV